MNWWQRVRHRGKMERELDAELRFHFDRLVDDYLRAGMSERAARRAARAEFGGLDQVKEACRDARGTRWVHDAAHDARFALRLLVKERGTTAVAVLALGCGLGVNTTLFSIVNAICIRGLAIADADRTVFVSARDARDRILPLASHEFQLLQTGVTSFSAMGAYTSAPATVGDEGQAADRATATSISPGAFGILGHRPILGRDFVAGDDRPGAPAVAILGHRIWRNRYASDPQVVGRTIRVNGEPTTVVGIMADGFRFPSNTDLWLPLQMAQPAAPGAAPERSLDAIATLADGVTLAGAREGVTSAATRLAAQYPDTNRDVRLTAVPINERFNGNIKDPAWVAFITVGALVVIIACSNVATLLLARSVRRGREMAIRLSLGATRRRIVRQLLAESVILAGFGGVAALGFAALGLRLFARAFPTDALPYWITFTMDGRVFLVLAAACLGTVVLFGLAPALHASRASVSGVLKDGSGSSTSGISARRWTAVFLTAEFALTVLLLAAVGLTVRNFQELRRKDPQLDASRLITTWVTLPPSDYRTPEKRLAFYRGLQARLDAVSAISVSTLATGMPFGGASQRHLQIDGRETPGDASGDILVVGVGPRYFETLGQTLGQGRAFTDEDGSAGRDTAIVNQRLADVFFQRENPIGRRIRVARDAAGKDLGPWLTIVGVSPAIRQRPSQNPDPVVYRPFQALAPATAVLLAKGPGDPSAVVPIVREEVRALDPNLPVYRAMTLERAAWEAGWNARVSAQLITTIALIALGLATLGLTASTAQAVAQRTREIGIRVALGARPVQVLALVMRRATLQIAAGLVMGTACTIVWERIFGGGAAMAAVSNLLGVALLLVVVAGGACLWPARRAAKLDPVRALRSDGL